MASEPEYPEHEKLKAISTLSQTCGEFLDWLATEKDYCLAEWVPTRRDKEQLMPVSPPITKLLAEFFEIDEDKIEDEKRAMLKHLRSLNEKHEEE